MEEDKGDLNMCPTVDHTSPNVCFGDIANIYVNKNILKPIIPRLTEEKTSFIYDKVYEVNGTIFREQNLDNGPNGIMELNNEEMIEFQIQEGAVDGGMELVINKYIDLNFQVSLQETPYGIILNSNILLSTNQWNTIIEQGDIQKCLICNTVVSNTLKHTHSATHKDNMEKYQPLNKFDLSIIRLIGDNYHCGVCNESFDRDNVNEHFDSKNHEERMLFATNRASDVMYDFDLSNDKRTDNENGNNDCYHFDRNRILSVSDTSGFNSECAEGFYDHDIEESTSVVFDNDIDVFNGTDFNDTNHVSYATMAKKQPATPEFLDMILYNKRWRVKFDTWHMVITPKVNHMYCMVCKQYEHISQKSYHCAREIHLKGLRSFKFVEAYKDYLVRKMDHNLYHCGLCNNLQLIDKFDDHIEYAHTKKPKHLLNIEEMPKTNRTNENKTNSRNTYNDEDVLRLKFHTTPSRSETPNSYKIPNTDTNNVNELPKYNDTNRNDTLKFSDTNRNDTPKYSDTNRNDTPKFSDTNRNETPKFNDTNRNEKPKFNDTNRNETPKFNDTNRNEKPKFNDTNRNETPKFNDTNRNETLKYNDTNSYETLNHYIYNYNTPYIVDVANRNETTNYNDNKIYSNEINDENPDISDYVTINQYGHNLRVSFLAYNVVVQRKPSVYYCHICDLKAPKDDIISHIYDVNHIAKLKRISFQRHYGINLIRMIACKDHCTICNVMFNIAHTRDHTLMATHVKLLDKALINQLAMNPSATGLTQLAMHQPDTDLNLPKVFANRTITETDLCTNDIKTDKDMNQCTTDSNHFAIDQTVFDVNQRAHQSESNVLKEKKSERKGMYSQQIYTDIDDSQSDEDLESFDDKFIHVKHKNVYTKITMMSYNSLIQIGNGRRYCFVCSTQVRNIGRHMSNNSHIKAMKECKFVIKYERHLLRQMFLTYHCSICNIIFPRSQINAHITWTQHLKDTKEEKKTKKNNFKTNVVDVIFQNETIYLKENEPVPKVLLKIDVKATKDVVREEKKNKIIIYDRNVLKISWDSWHSLRKDKNGVHCVLCQSDVRGFDIGLHVKGDYHKGLLEPFERQHLPCLIRKVNESTLNCVICNIELSNKDYIISEHINGKKHKKHYEAILIDSSAVESYADCNDDIFNL